MTRAGVSIHIIACAEDGYVCAVYPAFVGGEVPLIGVIAEAYQAIRVARRVRDGGTVKPALISSGVPDETPRTLTRCGINVDPRRVTDDCTVDVAEPNTDVPVRVIVAVTLGRVNVTSVRVDHSRAINETLCQR